MTKSDRREYWSVLAILADAAAALLLCGCSTVRAVADEYRDWRDSQTMAGILGGAAAAAGAAYLAGKKGRVA